MEASIPTSGLGHVQQRVAALCAVEGTKSENDLLGNLNISVLAVRELSKSIAAQGSQDGDDRGFHSEG